MKPDIRAPRKLKPIALLVMFFTSIAVCAFLLFIHRKMQALSFHEVDYPFYMQFSAKLFDPTLSARYSLNPEGGNWLGYTGVEGKDHFHQSLHFELVKYIFAIIYRFFGGPMGIFIFIAIVYSLPVVYLSCVHPVRDRWDAYFIFLFAVLYLGYPAAVHTISFDLRPRVLLVPFFSLSILSIHYRRPLWERLLFFGLLFFTREESLLLGAFVIVYNLLKTGDRRDRIRSTTIFLFIWFTSLVMIYGYNHWTNYEIDPRTSPFSIFASNPTLYFGGGLLFVILVGFGLLSWERARQVLAHPNRVPLVWYSLIFVILGWPLLEPITRYGSQLDPILAWISMNLSMQALYFTVVLILFVLFFIHIQTPRLRRRYVIFLALLAFSSVLFSMMTLPGFYKTYTHRVDSTDLVLQFRDSVSYQSTILLCDYETYQAFYNFERVFVYQRLPWYLVKGKQRYYPDNIPALTRLLETKVEYIVSSRQSLEDIQDILETTGQKPITVLENDLYIILQLR